VHAAGTYNRADSTSLGSTETGSLAWTSGTGTWNINNGRLRVTSPNGSTGSQCTVDTGHTDGTITATRAATDGVLAGWCFARPATTTPPVRAVRRGLDLQVERRPAGGGSFLTITSCGTAAAGDVVTVILNGAAITVRANGEQRARVTDATSTGARHGLFAYGFGGTTAAFDNFSHTS
jgi:hypothetical protein